MGEGRAEWSASAGVAKYRRRAGHLEAMRFSAEADLSGSELPVALFGPPGPSAGMRPYLWCAAARRWMALEEGDWIVKEAGEFFRVPDDVFSSWCDPSFTPGAGAGAAWLSHGLAP